MLKKNQWLEMAINFDLGNCPIYNRPIRIEARDQMDGSRLWVLKMHEFVLGKDAKFHYEPTPSGRTDEFIKNTRFDSPDEVHTFWKENIKEEEPLYID